MLNLKIFPLRSQSQKSADCSFFLNGRCAENCGQKWQNSPKTTKKVATQLLKLKIGCRLSKSRIQPRVTIQ